MFKTTSTNQPRATTRPPKRNQRLVQTKTLICKQNKHGSSKSMKLNRNSTTGTLSMTIFSSRLIQLPKKSRKLRTNSAARLRNKNTQIASPTCQLLLFSLLANLSVSLRFRHKVSITKQDLAMQNARSSRR